MAQHSKVLKLSDKVILEEKYKVSRAGCLISGQFLELLYLKRCYWCILPFYDHGNLESIQCPCWEFTSSDNINRYLFGSECTDLANLYTIWSRFILIRI